MQVGGGLRDTSIHLSGSVQVGSARHKAPAVEALIKLSRYSKSTEAIRWQVRGRVN